MIPNKKDREMYYLAHHLAGTLPINTCHVWVQWFKKKKHVKKATVKIKTALTIVIDIEDLVSYSG